MPYYRFEDMEQLRTNPHLSSGKGAIVTGTYMTLRNNNKEAGTGSQLHYHPNELMVYPISGKINAVVGKDHRIVEAGTFFSRTAQRAPFDEGVRGRAYQLSVLQG